jgi:hypothetical protein
MLMMTRGEGQGKGGERRDGQRAARRVERKRTQATKKPIDVAEGVAGKVTKMRTQMKKRKRRMEMMTKRYLAVGGRIQTRMARTTRMLMVRMGAMQIARGRTRRIKR